MNIALSLSILFVACCFGSSLALQIGQFYWVNWELDRPNSRITIEVEAQTTAFVGFGFSRIPEIGIMDGADIVVGGVDDITSRFYFTDRHGIAGHGVPVVDDSQDYTFIEAAQNATHTRVKFSRPLVTGDINDVDIIMGTQTVIWSFGESDVLEYHGGINRGRYDVDWTS